MNNFKIFSDDEIRQRYSLKLPTGYLSHGQMELWKSKGKESYRKTYYGGKRFGGNEWTEFGNKVTLAMANNEEWVSFIPRFPVFERKFIVDIDGIPFKGSIDNFDPATGQFAEQKTVKEKWSDNKIKKHKQFDRYSLAIELMDGFVDDTAFFVDVRTDAKNKTIMFDGHELESDSKDIWLTGEFNKIERIVTAEDRRAAYEEIVRVGREIEEDFAAFKHLYAPMPIIDENLGEMPRL